jgi:hypothetical protein
MRITSTPRRRLATLVAGTAISFASLTHGAVAHAAAGPGGPGGITTATTQPPTCDPKLASCDVSDRPHPKLPPPECNPKLASCDVVDRPHDPTPDPGDPGNPGTGGSDIDRAVPGSPTYTG